MIKAEKYIISTDVETKIEIVETLQKNLRKTSAAAPGEDEIEQILLARNLIGEIPKRAADRGEETYAPVELTGKPLSATVLEERE
jgi:hypothetical protein